MKNYKGYMEISTREYNLLWLLIKNEKGINIDYISKELKVSVRSVYVDIKNIKSYLIENYDIELKKKEKEYYLSSDDVRALMDGGFENIESDGFSNKPRKYQIIEYLSDMKTTTLQEIADKLYFSKSTINQEMKSVKKTLSKFSINLTKKPYHGIVISGTELNIRFLLQYIMSEQIESIDINLESIMFASKFLSSKIDLDLQDILRKYKSFNSTEMRICLNVMYHRVKNNHNFSASESIVGMYEGSNQLLNARTLLSEVEETLCIKFNNDEVYYLLINMNNYDIDEENQKYISDVLDSILDLIKEKYQYIRVRENIFYKGLMIHISKMLKRIKFGKVIRNPALGQTKECLPFAFNISADIAMMLKSSFDINMNEDEIGLLAMHIQAMMEENDESKDLKYEGIVASNIGYGNARMISGRLFVNIPGLNIKHQVSIEQMEDLIRERRIDKNKIIISTCPLSLPKSDYVLIHHIITDDDIEQVRKYLEHSRYEENLESENSGFIVHVPREHIYINRSFKTKESLLEYVCNRLYKTGYVTEDFYESTLARERISSTYALNGVALPHGYSKCVIKPGIAIVILDKPVDWDGYYADMVFVCALSLTVRESDKEIFEDMYMLLNNRNAIRQIKDCKDELGVIHSIRSFTKGDINEY